jgi:hypothetical protein
VRGFFARKAFLATAGALVRSVSITSEALQLSRNSGVDFVGDACGSRAGNQDSKEKPVLEIEGGAPFQLLDFFSEICDGEQKANMLGCFCYACALLPRHY